LVMPADAAIFAINSSLVIGSLRWWLATCQMRGRVGCHDPSEVQDGFQCVLA
jgi:hypothetical protein